MVLLCCKRGVSIGNGDDVLLGVGSVLSATDVMENAERKKTYDGGGMKANICPFNVALLAAMSKRVYRFLYT